MYVSSKCHLFTSLGYNAQLMLCGIIFFVCVKHKTEAFLSSRWPGGALKRHFCTRFVFETYETCATLVSDH